MQHTTDDIANRLARAPFDELNAEMRKQVFSSKLSGRPMEYMIYHPCFTEVLTAQGWTLAEYEAAARKTVGLRKYWLWEILAVYK